ncbi:MAG: hypothetical protein U0V73_09170 [Acidimicrobiia bacterium]
MTDDPSATPAPTAAPVAEPPDESPEDTSEPSAEPFGGTADAAPSARRPGLRGAPFVLVAVALVVRVGSLLSPRHLGFDDGVYGASINAMRHGGAPFRDVFSSQGPLFLPLVSVFDRLGAHWIDAPRLAAVAAGVAVTLAAYAIGCRLTDRSAAFLAALFVATSGTLLWTTGPLTSDGIAEAWACWGVFAALWYRRAPSWPRAVLVGLLCGAAVSTKSLLVGPAVLTAWVIVLGARRWRHVAAVPVVAASVLVLAALPWGWRDVYDQSVRYHLDKTGNRKPGANLHKVFNTLWTRDLPLMVAATLALVWTVVAHVRGRGPGRHPEWWPVIGWFVLAVAVVTWQDPMWRNHIAHVVVPLALLAACYRPPWKVLALVVLAIPVWVVNMEPLLLPHDYTGRDQLVERMLDQLPDGAGALSDEPGLVYRAGRLVPGNLVDASRLRVEAQAKVLRVTPELVAKAAARRDVCAVIVWSVRWSGTGRDPDASPTTEPRYRAFRRLPGLLNRAGYSVAQRWDDRHVVYVKDHCDPIDRTTTAALPARSRG